MAENITAHQVADAMYKMIKDTMGQKKWKATDLQKASVELFGDVCDKQLCKEAIRSLVDNGRLVYSYFGGSFLEIPHKEGAQN